MAADNERSGISAASVGLERVVKCAPVITRGARGSQTDFRSDLAAGPEKEKSLRAGEFIMQFVSQPNVPSISEDIFI